MDMSLQNFGSLAASQGYTQDALTRAGHAKSPVASMSMAQIDKTATDFEGMFAAQMLQPMFEGLETNPLFGGGHGEEMMKGFLVEEYGKIAARSGSLGIASAVRQELIRAQSASSEAGDATQAAASSDAAVTNAIREGGVDVSG